MNQPTPMVFVVDDEAPVRKAISRLLHSADILVAVFASAREFLAAYNPDSPGCLVLDLQMPELDGLGVQWELARRGGAPPIIFLSGHADVPVSVQAMKNGAVDFLTKPVRDQVLLAAVRAAFAKDRLARLQRANLAGIDVRLSALTPREREVLDHVVAGRLNKQIASDLGTAEQTIKVHRARVMEKMQVQSVAELVRLVERARQPGRDRHGTKVQ
jgi:FixJ family two-component response regulator